VGIVGHKNKSGSEEKESYLVKVVPKYEEREGNESFAV